MAGGPRDEGGAEVTVSAESLSEWCGARSTNGVASVVMSVAIAPLMARVRWQMGQCAGSGESGVAALMVTARVPLDPVMTRHAASSCPNG